MSSCGKGGVENRRAIGASWPVNKLIIPPGEEEESIYIYIYAVSIPSSTTIYDDSPWYLSRLICRDENLAFLSSVFPSHSKPTILTIFSPISRYHFPQFYYSFAKRNREFQE